MGKRAPVPLHMRGGLYLLNENHIANHKVWNSIPRLHRQIGLLAGKGDADAGSSAFKKLSRMGSVRRLEIGNKKR